MMGTGKGSWCGDTIPAGDCQSKERSALRCMLLTVPGSGPGMGTVCIHSASEQKCKPGMDDDQLQQDHLPSVTPPTGTFGACFPKDTGAGALPC